MAEIVPTFLLKFNFTGTLTRKFLEVLMVLGNNEFIQFILSLYNMRILAHLCLQQYFLINSCSSMACFKIIIHSGKGDLKDEKSRRSTSRNTGQDQLSFLGTPGTIMQKFAKMQRTLHCTYSKSDITGDVMESPFCT